MTQCKKLHSHNAGEEIFIFSVSFKPRKPLFVSFSKNIFTLPPTASTKHVSSTINEYTTQLHYETWNRFLKLQFSLSNASASKHIWLNLVSENPEYSNFIKVDDLPKRFVWQFQITWTLDSWNKPIMEMVTYSITMTKRNLEKNWSNRFECIWLKIFLSNEILDPIKIVSKYLSSMTSF